MLTRRDFLQVTAATAAMFGPLGGIGAAAAAQKITQDQLLNFDSTGPTSMPNWYRFISANRPLTSALAKSWDFRRI